MDAKQIVEHLAKCKLTQAAINGSIVLGEPVFPTELTNLRDAHLDVIPELLALADKGPIENIEEIKAEAEAAKLAACQTLDWVLLNGLTALEAEARAAKLAACQTLEWVCEQLPPTP